MTMVKRSYLDFERQKSLNLVMQTQIKKGLKKPKQKDLMTATLIHLMKVKDLH